jgi:hypothetical protein
MHFDHLIENILQGLATGKTEQQIADKHGVSVEQVMKQLEKMLKWNTPSVLKLPERLRWIICGNGRIIIPN